MLLGLSQPGPQQRRRSRDFSGHRSACRSQWFGAPTPRNQGYARWLGRTRGSPCRRRGKSVQHGPGGGVLHWSSRALFGPLFVSGLQLLNCLIVSSTFFINTRAAEHREQVVAPREGKGVNGGTPQEHRDRSHCCKATLLDYIRGDQPLFNKHVLRHHRRREVQDNHPSVTRRQVESWQRALKDHLAELCIPYCQPADNGGMV